MVVVAGLRVDEKCRPGGGSGMEIPPCSVGKAVNGFSDGKRREMLACLDILLFRDFTEGVIVLANIETLPGLQRASRRSCRWSTKA